MAGVSAIPTVPHFAIIQETSVYTPGDERSRTNPGHGYGESTDTYITYEVFADRAAWERRITVLTNQRESFRAIAAHPATVSTLVSVSVDEKSTP